MASDALMPFELWKAGGGWAADWGRAEPLAEAGDGGGLVGELDLSSQAAADVVARVQYGPRPGSIDRTCTGHQAPGGRLSL